MGLWQDIAAMADERIEVEVPGQEGPFYAMPCTVEDEEAVRRVVKNADSPATWARLMWRKLLKDDGTREFEGVTWKAFQEKVPGWLSRHVGEQIYLAGAQSTIEAAKKKSEDGSEAP